MVFEVINDRGLRLNPYEILKGKLLGKINKQEVDIYNSIWEKGTAELEKVENKHLVDTFFKTYLKAKYTASRVQARDFEGDYHKTIFVKDIGTADVFSNPMSIKEFLNNDFVYFTDLYKDIINWQDEKYISDYPELYFNYLNDLQSQEMLILSVILLNDPQRNEKVKAIASEVDRLFVFLQINGAYESNRFLELLFALMTNLKVKGVDQYRQEFDRVIIEEINTRRNTQIEEPLPYKYFREAGYDTLNTRMLRYILARVDRYLTSNLGIQMQDTMWNYVKGTGKSNGYHIEHILGRNNNESANNFESDEEFEYYRNRLGGLLLLKGSDNQSSSNEVYSEKLKTYKHTLTWNQTLTEDYYKSNTAIENFKKQSGLDIREISIFNKDAVEQRTQLLYAICKEIWK